MLKPKLRMSALTKFILLVLLFPYQLFAQQQPKNWLSQKFEMAYANAQPFSDIETWQNNNRAKIIAAAHALPHSVKQRLIKKADEALSYNWPSLTASLYLDYKFTGTRVNYERLRDERRVKLNNLAIGEIVENKGKYIPQIVNGLWLTMEESTWVGPAHIVVQKEGAGLPAVNTKYVDLHASSTAANLAMIYNLLGAQIAKYSSVVNPRLNKELQQRIFEPYLSQSNFFWMGFNGRSVNNWNAFNNTNCMQAALLTLKPSDTLSLLSKKILSGVDFFINQYPADGGCDEGPSYWDMAGGKLAYLLANLQSASDGKISLIDKPLVHAMGSYAYKMQISGNKMVNFADALATYAQNPNSVLTYGLMFNDEQLKSYAAYIFKNRNLQVPSDDLLDFASSVVNYQTFAQIKSEPPYPNSSILQSLQVWAARQKQGTAKGLFVAAKGGHNNESHNHNDIGNFILYQDGNPVLIDAGVGTYTSKTFSNKRYELWNVQSQWHNTPTINGFGQKNGSSYKATDFKHQVSGAKETLTMDIAKAYPKEAMVNRWQRTIVFDRSKQRISLREEFSLLKDIAKQELNFICAEKPQVEKGKLSWPNGITMVFNPKELNPVIEEKPLEDERIKKIWGQSIFRVKLVAINHTLNGAYQINFHLKN